MVKWTDHPDMTIAVDWDLKQQKKQTKDDRQRVKYQHHKKYKEVTTKSHILMHLQISWQMFLSSWQPLDVGATKYIFTAI